MKDMLWKIARSTNKKLYNRAACNWIVSGPKPEHWVKAFFPNYIKFDMLCNNLCEPFKAFILETRRKPIVSMMDIIRVSLMERIVRRRNKMRREPQDSVYPMMKDRIEEAVILFRS